MSAKERNEDLNPGSDDIEERVKRMLDPSIPDEPENEDTPVLARTDDVDNAVPENKTVKLPEDNSPEAPMSAPILPDATETSDKKLPIKSPASKSKKIIIPISHDSSEDENTKASVEGVEEPEKVEDDAADIDEVQEISLGTAESTPDDLAVKLDAAIAGLGAKKVKKQPAIADVETEADQAAAQTADSEPAEQDDSELPLDDPKVITDPETDKVVEAIIADEGDELLEMEDALRNQDEPVSAAKKPRAGLGQTIKKFWANRVARWLVIILLVVGIIVAATIPSSRYFVLNRAGVRAASSLTVIDASTQQPLKNVDVRLDGIAAKTDVDGKVQLSNIQLGDHTLTVEKLAFAPVTKEITLGWGSNPLGEFKLTPTGTQYGFTVTDFLTGKPLKQVEAISGESSAISDDKGFIKLTIGKLDDPKLSVTVKAENFRTEQISLEATSKADTPVKLVPSRKHVYISKRTGKFDMYSAYIDGRDEKLVLAGSGNEREDNLVVVPHPTANVAAFVSNRASQQNSDGFLLSNLILINLDHNTTTSIGSAERMQIVDWSKNYLVYVQIASGTSASSPKRYKLMSYNYQEETSKELAASNFFNDVVSANNAIFYAPSSAYQTGQTNLHKVNADGSGSQIVYNQEVWNIFRTSYDHFALSVQQQWFDYKFGDATPTKLNSAPANQITRVYLDSPDGKRSAWIDNRDGKGTLLSYDTTTKGDSTLKSQAGLTYPVRWLNDKVIVYRIKSAGETADYAVNIDGGEPVKIRDVTNSGGIDRWYYY